MSYEPRGKMIDLVAAVRAAPDRVFNMAEVCEILACKPFRSTVEQYLYAATADNVVFKREVNGKMFYAGQSLSDALLAKNGIEVKARPGDGRAVPPPTYTDDERARAMADPRAPKFGEQWKPPAMPVPRAGSDVRVPAKSTPGLDLVRQAEELDAEIRATTERFNSGRRSTSTATASGHEIPDSTATPKGAGRCEVANEGDARVESAGSAHQQGADASIAGDPAAEQDAVEFNAALWLDGDLVIYGAQELDDGGVLINREQLAKIRQLITQ